MGKNDLPPDVEGDAIRARTRAKVGQPSHPDNRPEDRIPTTDEVRRRAGGK